MTSSGHACHVVRRLMSKYALPVKDRAFSPSCREAPTQRLTKSASSARLRRPTECSCAQSLSLGAVRGGRPVNTGRIVTPCVRPNLDPSIAVLVMTPATGV